MGRCLGELNYVLAASPAYIAQRGDPKSIGELKDHACLRYLQGGRPQPFTFADNTRYYPDGLFDTDDAQYLIEASVRGAGIAQFMKLNIENDIANGRLQVVPRNFQRSQHPFTSYIPTRNSHLCGCVSSLTSWLNL